MVIAGVFLNEAAQTHLYGLVDIPGQVDHGAHVVVPGAHEGKDDQRGDGSLGKRQHDVRPDTILGKTVDAGRLAQLRGDGLIELPHQEHTEGAEGLQHHHGPEGIVETHGAHHDELGQHVGLPRHGNGGDVRHKQHIAPLEVELGKRIRRKGGGKRLQEGDHDGDEGSVLEVGDQRHLLPDKLVVFPVEGLGDPPDGIDEHLSVQLQGGGDHPHEGDQGKESYADEHDIEQHLAQKAQDRVILADGALLCSNDLTHALSASFLNRWRISFRWRTG